jgi:hypothetical protein
MFIVYGGIPLQRNKIDNSFIDFIDTGDTCQAPPNFTPENAFYVQQPISHGKTATQSGYGRLYRVLAHCNTQCMAFYHLKVCNASEAVLGPDPAGYGFSAF